jgi:hypothetical protein
MGIGIISILMDGKDDTTGVPEIEGPVENGMGSVGTMVLRDGNVDITGMHPRGFSPFLLKYGLDGSTTLDETIGSDMVGGWLNKEKVSLKISLTWISRGAFGSVKGGLKFFGGSSPTTSTSTKRFFSHKYRTLQIICQLSCVILKVFSTP